MNISLVSLLPLVSTIFVFGLGVFVFFKNPKSKLNIVFALIAVTVTIWLFGTFMMFNSGTDKQAIFWDRFIYMGVVFVPALMYHFSIIFSNNHIVTVTAIKAKTIFNFDFGFLKKTKTPSPKTKIVLT
ncbi:hypothetical protein KKC00_00855, partial [Patescibacteria group bacterium]|nr:hypothetical protein [Patescibacteria group bacterium]